MNRLNTLLRKLPVWIVYVVLALPPFWYLYLGFTGGLGVEPIKALEHELGELALIFVIVGLAITPMRRFLGLNLMKFRRAVGVMTFYYVGCHLLVWLVLDVQDPARIWADIIKRPYITVGMAAFLLLLPLAMSSNNFSVRRLGSAWRKLHRLVYPAAILAAVHYVLLAKGFQIEPLIYLAIIAILISLRLIPRGALQHVNRKLS